MHVGGSDEALADISVDGTFDLNQYWSDSYFWRSPKRAAPHNVYTSVEQLNRAFVQAVTRKEATTSLYGLWKFKSSTPKERVESSGITIQFEPPYRIYWQYDVNAKRYQRQQASKEHLTEDGHEIVADNVAIVITDVEILDAVGRRRVRTIGEGDAFVFQDGQIVEGTWRKPSPSERLRFFCCEWRGDCNERRSYVDRSGRKS